MSRQVVGVDAGVQKGVAGCAVGVHRLLRHKYPLGARKLAFEVGKGYASGQCRTEAHFFPLRVENDARTALIEGFCNFIKGASETGPYAHPGYNYSLLHILFILENISSLRERIALPSSLRRTFLALISLNSSLHQ